MKEIMVVDDEPLICGVFQYTADLLNKDYGQNLIHVEHFSLASEAMSNIEKRLKSYDAYFVDMRIPTELDLSEELFYRVRDKFPIDVFYFMTGHISGHDEDVLARTKAKCFVKPFQVCETLRCIIENKILEKYVSY